MKSNTEKLLYFRNLMGVCTLKCKDCHYKTEEFVVHIKLNVKDPYQCQECGVISETEEAICSHTNSISKTAPIFCLKCKSTDVEPTIEYI
jgi:hypothetical protein